MRLYIFLGVSFCYHTYLYIIPSSYFIYGFGVGNISTPIFISWPFILTLSRYYLHFLSIQCCIIPMPLNMI